MTSQITLDADRIDALMPMHVLVAPDGRIRHAGPTLAKVHPGLDLEGRSFFEVFEIRRPSIATDILSFCRTAGSKVSLRMRDADRTPVTGSAICLSGCEGVLINLSFGIAVVEAVARFELAGSDFAATDLTLELLYLVEANAAAMEGASRTGMRLAGAKDAAEAEALTDPLTGLYNRRALEQALHRLTARGTAFSLMHVDLDFFKAVNDTHGHAAGDAVLQTVAQVLRGISRGGDVVARVGGDEFVVVFIRTTHRRKLSALAESLIEKLEVPIPVEVAEARISASIGITTTALYEQPKIDRMERDADAAVYASKERGRGCHTFATPTPAGPATPAAPACQGRDVSETGQVTGRSPPM